MIAVKLALFGLLMNKYLKPSEYIDFENPALLTQTKILAEGALSPEEVTQKCFEFVSVEIKHSWDYKLNPITCKASDVLRYRTVTAMLKVTY